MGRGNVCTHNECEGLYYLDKDFLETYCKAPSCKSSHEISWEPEPKTARELQTAGIQYDYNGSHSDWAFDSLLSEKNWNNMLFFVKEALQRRFKSFYEVDKWRNDRHIVLQNKLFEIAVVDNEWSVAWCLLEREDADCEGRNRMLMRRHFTTYLDAIKRIIVVGWGEAIGYGGAWTKGQTYLREDLETA